MDIGTFGTGQFAGSVALIGLLLFMLALLIGTIALFIGDSHTERGERTSLLVAGGGGAVGALGALAIAVFAPVALVATFFYTPPPEPPVPASTVTLTAADGQDRVRFAVVCEERRGEVELVGEREGNTFRTSAYRLRMERDDIAEPVRFSIGLRFENKGWGGRFGGQPSWMENVVSGDGGIRADGEWQAGYMERPLILSVGNDYSLRVGIGETACPHLVAVS